MSIDASWLPLLSGAEPRAKLEQLRIRVAGRLQLGLYSKSMRYGLRLKHIATLSRQLHVLVSSGTPLTQALGAIERQCEDTRWKQVLEALRKRVEDMLDEVTLFLFYANDSLCLGHSKWQAHHY